jgi:5'-3' exonuclease
MGIRSLNKYILQNCNKSLRYIHLRSLSGKTIVIDTSIYLYKFIQHAINDSTDIRKIMDASFQSDTLLSYFDNFIKILLQYKIVPIFVFDGCVPLCKQKTIEKRQLQKKEAKHKFRELYAEHCAAHLPDNTVELSNELFLQMKSLRAKHIYISREEIDRVKNVLIHNDIKIINAPAESDEICADMVITHKADMCMSDDSDLLILGCPTVLREFDIDSLYCTSYSLNNILFQLNITLCEFQQTCSISSDISKFNIYKSFKSLFLFKKLHACSDYSDFIRWHCYDNGIEDLYEHFDNVYCKYKNRPIAC